MCIFILYSSFHLILYICTFLYDSIHDFFHLSSSPTLLGFAFAAAKASSTQPDSVSSDSSDSFLSTQQPTSNDDVGGRQGPRSKRPMPGHFPKQFAKVGRPEVVGRQVECQPEELDVASCYRVLQIAWMFKKSRMRCSICFLLLLLSFFKCFSSKLESFLQQGIEQ